MKTATRLLTLLTLCAALVSLTGCPQAPTTGGNDSPSGAGKANTAPGAGAKGAVSMGGGQGMKPQWGDPNGIVIGSYLPLTGGIATFGQSSNMAMGMAIEQINAKGGVLGGKMLQLVVEDSASKAEEAANAAQRLIDVRKAVLALGEVASTFSIAAAPAFQKAGIPMLTPASTSPRVTKMGDCIFRSCYTDDQQGAYIARFALKKGLKRAAILKDINNDYSKGLTEVITREYDKAGLKIDATEAYQAGNPDFNAVLTSIKDKQPEVIFIPGYYGDVALIIKQARELGITAVLVGGDGWDSPRLAEIAGAYLDKDCYFINHYAVTSTAANVQAFVSEFKQRYNEEPDALAALAYDAVGIAVAAIARAKSTDKAAIKKALGETKDYDGVTGKITIDANRDASKSCVVLAFKGGKQVVAATMTPADLKS